MELKTTTTTIITTTTTTTKKYNFHFRLNQVPGKILGGYTVKWVISLSKNQQMLQVKTRDLA